MEEKSINFNLKPFFTRNELKRIKITEIDQQNLFNITLVNNANDNLETIIFELLIKIILVLNHEKIKYSISYQYKNDEKNIEHIDIAYQM